VGYCRTTPLVRLATRMGLGKMLKEKVTRIQELRRSNAATYVKSKKVYSRKQKYKNKYSE